MDGELLLSLIVLWTATTFALVRFMLLWFSNGGQAFHPHSVDVDHRHHMFVVVHSETVCKLDCAVKSVSTYVAPRGSSSSKQFTVLCAIISVAGFLGTHRWHRVGDASETETLLALWGFGLLLLVAAFELDVVPERFLEDKLMVTAWLLKRAGHRQKLPFRLHSRSPELLRFVRESEELRHLYEEQDYLDSTAGKLNRYQYDQIWGCLHIFGATGYVFLVTASVIVNEIDEVSRVAGITGAFFFLFCLLGYLTGGYLPVLPYFRCWIMIWNPFVREPCFLLKLKRAVDAYEDNARRSTATKLDKPAAGDASASSRLVFLGKQRRRSKTPAVCNEAAEAAAEDQRVLQQHALLWYARRHPHEYLRAVGRLLVLSELVAMLTPAIAIGIQWMTALCPDTPPVLAMIDLLRSAWTCGQLADPQRCFEETLMPHCIIKVK